MKKTLLYGLSAVLTLTTILGSHPVHAAIDAKINFETGIPKAFVAGDNSTLTPSTKHFKDGQQSMLWSWTAPSTLQYNDFGQLMRSFRVKKAGIMLWIYNPRAVDADLHFAFETPTGETPYYFDFHLDFTGWRACWIKYGDMPGDHSSQQISRMVISTPEGVTSGELFLDRLTFAETKLHDQITPDQQIPDNNCNLKRSLWHWARLWEWEQYPAPEVQPLTDSQQKMLDLVEERMDKFIAASNSSDNYVKNTLLKRADDMYSKYGLKRLPDGSVTGAPLLSDDEFNNSLGEMRIRYIGQIIYYYAQQYYYTGSKDNLERVFVTMDHAIDQGFAYGSGQGTNHHYGYQIRELYKGMWLLRDEIAAAGKTDEYQKVLEYWSGLAETRLPFQKGANNRVAFLAIYIQINHTDNSRKRLEREAIGRSACSS